MYMENINSNSNNKKIKAAWKVLGVSIIVILLIIIGAFTCKIALDQAHAPGTIRNGVIYLNHDEIYVYDSLESALTDTKCQDGPPKPLKYFLPEILEEGKLVYLEGTTVGVCIDKQITEEEIPDSKSKEDRVVYKIGNYFLAESIPGE